MPVFAHIVDGVLQSVGELPFEAKRFDTGQMVSGAELLARLPACRYYPLNVDVATLTTDPAKRTVLTAGLAAALARKTRRDAFEDAVHARTDLARDLNWDWIDQFCHPNVASFPYVSGQSPNAGASWGAPTAAQAADRLRLAVSYLLVENVQFSLAHDLETSVIADLIEGADIDPPADR